MKVVLLFAFCEACACSCIVVEHLCLLSTGVVPLSLQARENGLAVLPDRMHDSHMLYRVGRCVIYFSLNVIYCRVNGNFQPVSLEQLLSMAA